MALIDSKKWFSYSRSRCNNKRSIALCFCKFKMNKILTSYHANVTINTLLCINIRFDQYQLVSDLLLCPGEVGAG